MNNTGILSTVLINIIAIQQVFEYLECARLHNGCNGKSLRLIKPISYLLKVKKKQHKYILHLLSLYYVSPNVPSIYIHYQNPHERVTIFIYAL